MKVAPRQDLPNTPHQLFVLQMEAEILISDFELKKRPYRWSRWVFLWLVVFAIAGLVPASGDVKSLDGTIKFDSNFDGAPEAILNSTGFGIGTTSPSANLHTAGNAIVSGTMVVGGTSNTNSSNLQINGSWGFSVQTVTGNTTLSSNSVVLADSSAGNITLTLPVASTVNGRMYTIKKTSNSHTLLLGSATLIDGLPGIELSSSSSAYPFVQVLSDGSTWRILSRSTDGIVSSTNVYIIVDVSGGPTATSYPVTVSNLTSADLTGAGNLQYKTNKIVLRYIPSGNFTMGSPVGEDGRFAGKEAQHSVTLTQGFYLGVFELTQQQYRNVVASYPTGAQFFTNSSNTMPMHNISYTDIRGSGNTGDAYDYPNSGNAVLSSSFMGLLRSKAGLSFDLPTEAQWEYACRAGTTGALNTGSANIAGTGVNIEDQNLKTLGWYDWNATTTGGGAGGIPGTREVGAKLPNSWGLFDMHGNVWELTLDWSVANNTSFTTNPVGPSSGSDRVVRGGSWDGIANYCRSAFRHSSSTSYQASNYGFRLALPAGQ